jgi:hypothetical protein
MIITAKVSVNSIYYSNTNKQRYHDMIIHYIFIMYRYYTKLRVRLSVCDNVYLMQ